MNTIIALFRGINVGGKHILPMKELVSILEALGYANVQTYIQSGNVVFSSQKKLGQIEADTISKAILDKKGFEPKVLLLSAMQLQDAITNNPFSTDSGKALHFYFLTSQSENPDFERLNSLKSDTEKYALVGNVFYLFAPDGIGRSKLATAVEKSLGVPVTARNWNTVSKVSAMVEEV